MDTAQILLKTLKNKHIINDIFLAEKEIATDCTQLKKPTDLFIRDSITGMGTILMEDLENHYYITSVSVKSGVLGKVLTYALIHRRDSNADIIIYAHEGLIHQNLSQRTIEIIKKALT